MAKLEPLPLEDIETIRKIFAEAETRLERRYREKMLLSVHHKSACSDVPSSDRPNNWTAIVSIVKKLKAWYDSDAVRFLFFREKRPVHRVIEALGVGEAVALISTVGIGSMILARIGLQIVGQYTFGGGVAFLAALLCSAVELAHCLFDRP